MDLQDIKDVVQIIFSISVIILAILTFNNAKKAIFSSINTEYQKRAFDSLDKISKSLFLYSEKGTLFGSFLVEWPMAKEYKKFQKEFQDNPERVEKYGFDDSEFSNPLEWEILHKIHNSIECDIFIPEEVRTPLLKLLSDRRDACFESHQEALILYVQLMKDAGNYKKLASESFSIDLENFYIHNLETKGFGMTDGQIWNENVFNIISLYVQDFHHRSKN